MEALGALTVSVCTGVLACTLGTLEALGALPLEALGALAALGV